jgi:hypothetical protein
MRRTGLCALVISAGVSLLAAAPASAQSCGDLWVARNSIFKEYGYCFKTARAIRHFGNAGCQYDREGDLPMSRGDRARVDQIVRRERAQGCR